MIVVVEGVDAMKIRHGLIAISLDGEGMMNINHFCGYENKPNEIHKAALEQELNTDPQFGLVGRIGKDVHLFDAPSAVVEMYAKDISFKEACDSEENEVK
jgi:hypothetical protein